MTARKVSPGTKTATAKAVDQATPDLTNETSSMEEMLAQFAEARANLFDSIQVPTWTQRAISAVIALVSSASTLYWGLAVADYLVVAVMTLTGPGFIAFIAAFVAMCLVWVASIAIIPLTYDKVMNFDVSSAKATAARGWASITSKFTRTPTVQSVVSDAGAVGTNKWNDLKAKFAA